MVSYLFLEGHKMKKGLSKLENKIFSIFSPDGSHGKLLIRGRLKWASTGFIMEEVCPSYICVVYISKRALIKRKRLPDSACYDFFVKKNYNIFKKPSTGGFEYEF